MSKAWGNEATLFPHSGWETCSSLNHIDQIVVQGWRGQLRRGGAGTRIIEGPFGRGWRRGADSHESCDPPLRLV